jgi:hypothetical protein
MNDLESTILSALLSGNRDELAVLREQAKHARIQKRENTGVGFFTEFAVAAEAPRLNRSRLIISDVGADLDDLDHGAGFVLFVQEGAIHCLEGFSFDEPWPSPARIRRWYYLHHPRPDAAGLVETADRDLDYALSNEAG